MLDNEPAKLRYSTHEASSQSPVGFGGLFSLGIHNTSDDVVTDCLTSDLLHEECGLVADTAQGKLFITYQGYDSCSTRVHPHCDSILTVTRFFEQLL